ncbi:general transcription factor IIH subunit 1-like protein [Sarcoptes scabiei]|uniref:General transcription factor IIH subunit 1-like protein n=1 Tax=Sarcoptes scabiei TaxID=52283 RepID=A0A131ZSR9_SARSC|nr:general transcription factor IIH subunit 1-like protein [Sarcoptes scabiei]
MAQSEDVRAMIEFVRVKKADGTLYLMNERIAWMPNGKNTFTISHNYADIKTQKISPEGKPKIQLQIVLANGSDTFHFFNPKGPQAQLEDRNQVKEILQQMLPLFRRKISQEMEQKWKILVDNPKLYQLYKELVPTNIITTEQFWETYATRKLLALKGVADSLSNKKERIGVSSAFLADVKPQSDGQNGIHYNITSEIIEAIFQTYPAVKQKHFECVPHKLNEQEFWQRFFQSHYFHRDRTTSMKDLFNECAKQDEQDIQRAIKKGITDPYCDIRAFDDTAIDQNLLEQFGPQPNAISSNKVELSANKALIRRFNFHSIMVLDACSADDDRNNKTLMSLISNDFERKKTETKQNIENKSKNENDESDEKFEEERRKAKKRRLKEAIEYDDLSGKKPSIGASIDDFDEGIEPPRLTVTNTEHALTNCCFSSTISDLVGDKRHSKISIQQALYKQLSTVVGTWRPYSECIQDPKKAIQAINDFSPGGILMKNASTVASNLKDEIPKEILNELKQLTMALNEILYHFWHCVPTNQFEKKFIDIKETLDRFNLSKLQPFHDRVSREIHRDLTSHLFSKIELAYNRFSNWNTKRLFQNKK